MEVKMSRGPESIPRMVRREVWAFSQPPDVPDLYITRGNLSPAGGGRGGV